MYWTNYHMHCYYYEGELEVYVIKTIDKECLPLAFKVSSLTFQYVLAKIE